ncbi:Cytochrome b-c1 complex subunit 6 [Erysiphe neolycopersici]|uniref:Cytochrome b-c1 complex subunit 6, mitochondrial n=1 Tax=Erysiphe neolycopersici TaxID=212602 RepID=A0A420HTX8_9PEZI|nr:Cytochrome b-c1 complex subunit 6 [Erysiphe neolycopersici]
MGVSTSWSDIIQAVLPWTESYAEEPVEYDEKNNNGEDGTKNELSETEPEAEEAEEEEEEEDLVDPKDTLEEECKNSKACSPAKHHYEECVERVTSGHGAQNEDCVEEFFHLIHCASTCAAPKLWKALK